MKSVEDRIVAAVVHGLVQAHVEEVGRDDGTFADRAIEIARLYLKGEKIGDYSMKEYEDENGENTTGLLNLEFSNEGTIQ
jgi:hypothetical protein